MSAEARLLACTCWILELQRRAGVVRAGVVAPTCQHCRSRLRRRADKSMNRSSGVGQRSPWHALRLYPSTPQRGKIADTLCTYRTHRNHITNLASHVYIGNTVRTTCAQDEDTGTPPHPPSTPTACTCGPTVLSPKPASRFVPPLVQVLVCWSGVVPPPEGVLRVGLGVPRAVDSAAVCGHRHRGATAAALRPPGGEGSPLGPRKRAALAKRAGLWGGGWPRARHAHRGSFDRAGGAADQGT